MPDGLLRSGDGPILLTTDAVGGVWRYTLDLARRLSTEGVPVHIVTLGPRATAAHRAELAGLSCSETELPLAWTADGPAALATTTSALRDLAATLRASSIHLHEPALAGSARWPVPVVAVCHSCTATWWAAVHGTPLPSHLDWQREATRAGLESATVTVAPTHAHAQAVTAAYGARPIAVVHNGSDFAPLPSRGTPAVLTAGRLWDEAKGAGLLDRLAPSLGAPLHAAGPLAGPGGGAVSLPNLRLLGTLDVPLMRQAYASATVFAAPGRYEPFGLSVLEAARAGLRLVLADIPTFRELWDGAATFVAADDLWLPALRSALEAKGDGGARARAARYRLATMAAEVLALHRRVGAHA